MAIRFKSHSAPKSRDALLWIVVAVLVIWGGWQAVRVRQQVLMALHPRQASSTTAPTTQAATVSMDLPPADFSTSLEPANSPVSGAAPDASAAPEIIRVLAPGLLAHTRGEIIEAQDQLHADHLLTARRILQRALNHISGFGDIEADHIRTVLTSINRRSVLGSAVVPGDPLVKIITVQSGDSLDYLAKLYRITPALIQQLNPGLQPQALIPGTGVKVILGPMDAHIILHALRVDVTIRNRFIIDFPLHQITPIEPGAGRYRTIRYIPGPLGLDEWILQSRSGSERLILAGGDFPDADITLSPKAISALHQMINPEFSRIDVEP